MVRCLYGCCYFIDYYGEQMNISIRKSKHQKTPMTGNQFAFAARCVESYRDKKNTNYMNYNGHIDNEKMGCDVYTTKTQISAVVYHG